MLNRATSFFLLGLLLGCFVATSALVLWQRADRASGGGVVSNKITLRLGHVLDQQHPVHTGMAYMAQRLDEISGGTVRLQIFPNGQLGSETECIEQVQRGVLAMVKTSAAAMEGFVPEMAVFGLPYIFRDDDHYWDVLLGDIGQELLRVS
jgi:TRAP-type C4-dicarboxylate transport system substrate-binding protein